MEVGSLLCRCAACYLTIIIATGTLHTINTIHHCFELVNVLAYPTFISRFKLAFVSIPYARFCLALHCNRFYGESKCKYVAIPFIFQLENFLCNSLLPPFQIASFFSSFFSSFRLRGGGWWVLHATEMYARRDNYQIKSGWNSL